MLFLIKTYLWTVLVFIIAKLSFMFFCREGHVFSFSDIWQVITHGLTLDLSTALYFLIMPFLVTMVSVWWNNGKVLKRILYTYFIIISIAFALAFVADTSLYPFWGFKLDASCLQYLSTPNEAAASVSVLYLIIRFLALILTAGIICFGYIKALQFFREAPQKQIKAPRIMHKASETVFYLLCIPLIVIGIRGGLNESTTNIGQVYYSQDQFLNHSAVNPVFSFLASFEKTASNNTIYHFMEDGQCEQIISEYYNTRSEDVDTLLNTQTPNIILILLEGCGGTFTEIGGRTDITPHLNKLSQESIYFTNCYGNTWRTDRGTVCAWSGYPSFPSMSVMKIPSKSRTLPNIAKTLQTERGYNTRYLYGGDINFTNMRSYLIAGGFQQLTSQDDYTAAERSTARWGVKDDITFETLYQMATETPSPYLIGFSTLSSHAPWDVPIRKFDDEVVNAFYYLDQCLGRFIQKFRQSEVWKNTLVILIPDHGIPHKDVGESNRLMNHIPMIWTGGAIKEPRRIEQVCNQTDLPATLLGQLGLNHDAYSFSRDVLSSTYTKPFAIHTCTEGFSMYDSVSFVNYDMISDRIVVEEGPKNPELLQRARAILQAASNDLNER
ncbi:MAG: sulfatase-like hydrolase/transferase [Prevotella sp.]|nr:sulfatase-like hydrolase/transferase [Prevotella sp.]